MDNETRTEPQTGEWVEGIPDAEGRTTWAYSTDYDGTAECYLAEIIGEAVGDGPFRWAVGKCPESGAVIASGEAKDLETAQQQAEQAFAWAVNQ